MRFVFHYPELSGPDGDLLDAGDFGEVAAAAERSGFSGISVSEHPAPGARWLASGGHQTLDPFVALAFAAARTSRLRLLTCLAVAPYRNPALLAKQAATLDRLSAGRLILGLGAVPALLGLVLRARMPESPRWLLRRHRYEDARRTLGRLGVEAGLDEVERTAHQLEETDRRHERDRRRGWSPGVRRALVVVCVFFVFQQITGINVPLYYGPHLLGPIFQENGSKMAQTTSGIEVTAIMTAVNVAATYLAFRWIDRIGRRKLAIGGYLGMGVMALVAAAGLGFLGGTAKVVVVMAGLSLFIAAFAIGVGGTGWLLQGEVFPTAVRGQAASIGAAVDWVANFALIEVIPIWQSGVGLGWVMVSFAALCVLAVVFVHRFLPETRGRSVEEITAVFERQAAA
jgi:MFS family permease